MTQASTDYILRTQEVVKRYKALVALDHVSVHIRRGTIHGLLGENGAGKSTLVSLISGLISPTEGKIFLDGKEVQGSDVKEMEARGVFLVTQEPMIVEQMTVADNLLLGHWPVKRGLPGVVDQRALHDEAVRALAGTGLDAGMLAGQLSAVEKRKLNILRALFSGGKLLILDEPTAALTLADRDHMFDFMRELKASGVSFVFISHYNEEILNICDGVSVLRNGRLAGEMDTLESIDSDALSQLVIGRDVPLFHRHNPGKKTGSGWRVDELRAPGVEIDHFEIAPGEIVGFAGLPGSGAKELAKVLFGLNRASAGSFSYAGKPIALPDHPQSAFAAGIAYLSDDRRRDGFVGLQSIGNNISMSSLGELSVAGIVDKARERRMVDHYFDTLRVKAATSEIAVGTLSGGNAQKVVLSRLLATRPRLLILDEPTRGIDVGVKEEIHQLVDSLTSEGLSVIVITSDLDELVRLVDRVCVFVGGRVQNEYVGAELNKDAILEAAFGTATV
jgi:simple sugar transport system ATP-binding protein